MKMRFSSMQTHDSFRQLRMEMICVAVILLLLIGGITIHNVLSTLPAPPPLVSSGATNLP